MRILLALLCCPLLAGAEGSATWQASSVGAALNYRGMVVKSPSLNPPEQISGRMTLVAWQYQLLLPAPRGLKVQLCAAAYCVPLDAPGGTTLAFSGIRVNQPLIFTWEVAGQGRFYPPVRVTSNQVIVNYGP